MGFLRGGAFKPRTSPYSFQGGGENALQALATAARESGLRSVVEATDVANLDAVADAVDIVQVGARNAQAFPFLLEVGKRAKAVLLKRGFGCTVSEWIASAEWIAHGGCTDIILCERGIRTFEPSTRFTLDVSAIAVAKRLTRLPVAVDASHPAGRRDLVAPLAAAGLAAGADAVMVEVHPDPDVALSDSAQQIRLSGLESFRAEVGALLRRGIPE